MRSIKSGAVVLLIMVPLIIALANAGAADGGCKDGVIHGDTSTPDEELLKQYGDKVPDRPIINEFTKKLGGSFFSHKEHVDAKRARCDNCHHKNPREAPEQRGVHYQPSSNGRMRLAYPDHRPTRHARPERRLSELTELPSQPRRAWPPARPLRNRPGGLASRPARA